MLGSVTLIQEDFFLWSQSTKKKRLVKKRRVRKRKKKMRNRSISNQENKIPIWRHKKISKAIHWWRDEVAIRNHLQPNIARNRIKDLGICFWARQVKSNHCWKMKEYEMDSILQICEQAKDWLRPHMFFVATALVTCTLVACSNIISKHLRILTSKWPKVFQGVCRRPGFLVVRCNRLVAPGCLRLES